MTAAVYTQIAAYFKKMHTDVVWPTMTTQPAAGAGGAAGQQPVFGDDKLVEFQRLLAVSLAKAVRIFHPAKPSSESADDCQCGHKKVASPDGPYHDKTVMYSEWYLQPCEFDDDCRNQDEICVNGFCVKKPYGVMAVKSAFNPDAAYYEALQKSVVSYYAVILDALAAGLGRNPSKLGDVRDFLMEVYAGALEAAAKLPCGPNNPCAAGTVCVKGHCVPYPFRLVFHVPGTPLPPPWEA